MRFKDSFKTALLGITHAKMRSFLTILGIVIGVTSVIVLMSIGQSAQDLILNQVEGIGSNLIFIVPGGTNGKFQSPAAAQGIIIKTLVQNDVDALSREPSVSAVVPLVSGQANAVYGSNNLTITYQGTTADFFPVRNYTVVKGSPFTNQDVAAYNHFAVIGSELTKTLFGPSMNPIGKNILIGNDSFRVTGVLSPMGVGPGGVNQDDIALIPVTVAQKQMLGINYFQYILVSANPQYNTSFVVSRIQSILEQNHSITNSSKDDFTIETQAQILSILSTITSVMTFFLAAIASISLLVGGIGIMNIMLVSVVERTREIGLRKAIGATNKDILGQFLLESVFLTFLGGVTGIALGSLITVGVYFVLTKVVMTSWVFALPWSAIALGAGVSIGTGIVFGIYPARQASLKSPIEALRYE